MARHTVIEHSAYCEEGGDSKSNSWAAQEQHRCSAESSAKRSCWERDGEEAELVPREEEEGQSGLEEDEGSSGLGAGEVSCWEWRVVRDSAWELRVRVDQNFASTQEVARHEMVRMVGVGVAPVGLVAKWRG